VEDVGREKERFHPDVLKVFLKNSEAIGNIFFRTKQEWSRRKECLTECLECGCQYEERNPSRIL
jgi:hypothetical protein